MNNMLVVKCLLALVLAIAACGSTWCRDNDQSHRHRHRHRSAYTNGIRNLHEVHPWLFRGGQPPDESFKTLQEMGVTTVVDLRDRSRDAQRERLLSKKYGMNFVQIPMSHRQQPSKQQVDQFLKIVATAKEHAGKGSVFVHCELGDDRTGCMIGISRIAFDNYTFDRAYEEMLHFGFSRHFTVLTDAVRGFSEEHSKVTAR